MAMLNNQMVNEWLNNQVHALCELHDLDNSNHSLTWNKVNFGWLASSGRHGAVVSNLLKHDVL